MQINKIGAVVVIFQPQIGVVDNIKAISDQYDLVVVYNNSSNSEIISEVRKFSNVIILGNGKNVGIAQALSDGTAYCINDGMNYTSTFDQDTRIPKNFRLNLEESIAYLQKYMPRAMIIGSNYTDINLSRVSPQMNLSKFFFKRFVPREYSQVTSVISSGTTFNSDLHREIGLYINDMFIDYVDNEICYRSYKAGYITVISPLLMISHSLGDREEYSIGRIKFRPTNHNPIRKYYISRNRIYCVRKYWSVLPGLLPFEFLAISNDILRVAIFENKKKNKLGNIMKGLVKGILFQPKPLSRIK